MSIPTTYQLRAFDSENMSDVERVNLMFYHPTVMKARGYFGQGYGVESQADLHEVDRSMSGLKSKISRVKTNISLAVTDRSGVVGWIWFYHDSQHLLPKRVQNELGLNEGNSWIYQVSYEKLLSTGWTAKLLRHVKHVTPEYLKAERKGVIVEGLRLAVIKLRKEFRAMHKPGKKLVLYAFVSLDNIASDKVLEKNDFVKIERQYKYDGELQSLWVKII